MNCAASTWAGNAALGRAPASGVAGGQDALGRIGTAAACCNRCWRTRSITASSRRWSPGIISIQISSDRDRVQMLLRNPYREDGSHHSGNNMALANISERLSLHFDAEASLQTRTRRRTLRSAHRASVREGQNVSKHPQSLRVVIADDEAPARSRIKDLLEDCAGSFPLEFAGEAASGRELARASRGNPCRRGAAGHSHAGNGWS